MDVLVPRTRLGTVEARRWRSRAGRARSSTRSDQRYYRDWSHELPPLRYPGQTLELDVHHDILPHTGRVHPDAQALFDASVPVPGTRFRALGPEDQLVHAAVHLFQDSDLNGRLRDLVDIDMLVRAHGTVAGFWMRLTERGTRHQASRALWYALGGAHSLLRTPIPGEALDALEPAAPAGAARMLIQRLVPLALLPNDPDRLPTLRERAARGVLFARCQRHLGELAG